MCDFFSSRGRSRRRSNRGVNGRFGDYGFGNWGFGHHRLNRDGSDHWSRGDRRRRCEGTNRSLSHWRSGCRCRCRCRCRSNRCGSKRRSSHLFNQRLLSQSDRCFGFRGSGGRRSVLDQTCPARLGRLFFFGEILFADFIRDGVVERVGRHADNDSETPRVFDDLAVFEFKFFR